MINVVVLMPHQGMGDHIICNGLYRTYSKKYKLVFLVVKQSYVKQVRYMIKDRRNIFIIPIPNYRPWTTIRALKIVFKILKIKVIGLGSFGKNFFPPNTRFDKNFYDQANLEPILRWSEFYFLRNLEKEEELFEKLGCKSERYIFLHEDRSRNYIIDRNKINSTLKIVQPLTPTSGYEIFDYIKILEFASEIHVIESSFAALIESLNLKTTKFAHRYARPHANLDFRHEFTYKTKWTILK